MVGRLGISIYPQGGHPIMGGALVRVKQTYDATGLRRCWAPSAGRTAAGRGAAGVQADMALSSLAPEPGGQSTLAPPAPGPLDVVRLDSCPAHSSVGVVWRVDTNFCKCPQIACSRRSPRTSRSVGCGSVWRMETPCCSLRARTRTSQTTCPWRSHQKNTLAIQ